MAETVKFHAFFYARELNPNYIQTKHTKIMKKTIKKLALLPLFCGLLLTSACSNDDNGYENGYNGETELGEKLLPSRISSSDEYDGELWIINNFFTFDNQNRITSFQILDLFYADGDTIVEWDHTVNVTYNANGTLATITSSGEWGTITNTFIHSGNTITRIMVETANGSVWRDTFHFEINDRGQIVREWDEDWELVHIRDANGNVTRIVEREIGSSDTEGWVRNFEYSTTVRAIFRYTTTPEWAFLFFGDLLYYEHSLVHGFMPTRIWWSEDGDWQEVFTYTVENGWVQTMTAREEYLGGAVPAVQSLRGGNSPRFGNDSRSVRSNRNPSSNTPRRTAPMPLDNGDYDEWTLHFEYITAR